jgi:MFS transporter, FSR family, fosmidomycin resistance protein
MTDTARNAGLSREVRVIALVCMAHFVSHYYLLMLPPLFAIIRADYDVSYTELGLALTAFGIVSGTLQTPAGFLVDRIGARRVLIAGLIICAGAYMVAGLVHSFWVFVAMFAIAGLGNTSYHPADYAVLSHEVSEGRVGHAFSAHNFSGMLGGAVTPATLLLLYGFFGWRGAYIASAVVGLAAAAVLALMPPPPKATHLQVEASHASGQGPTGIRLLLMPVILLNWGFFFLLAFINTGLQTYAAVAALAVFGTPLSVGNAGLTALLAGTAVGALLGGFIATRFGRHALTASFGVAITGICAALIGTVDLGHIGFVVALAVAGLANGCAMPSRDMLVRAVTPPGSFGKVFGFISTGFNFAGVVAPIVFGQIMDHGDPRLVFLLTAAACVLGVGTVMTNGRRIRR